MTLKTFKHELMEGIPNELPPAYKFNPNLNHAPKRKDSLNNAEKKLTNIAELIITGIETY